MATNYANATYMEVIDLQTTTDSQSVIGIHTPVGLSPYNRLKGFFQQFRKFKYNGIKSLVMIPAAQLPVDPLGLTGVVGTTDLMDPRDSLNPILFHGAHGESLDSVLDEIYGSVSNVLSDGNPSPIDISNTSPTMDEFVRTGLDQVNYYSKLTDSTWRKFGIQQGVKLSNLRPLVWQVAQNMPTIPSWVRSDDNSWSHAHNRGLFETIGVDENNDFVNIGVGPEPIGRNLVSTPTGNNEVYRLDIGDSGVPPLAHVYKQQFTNRMTTLGWLPTAYDNGVNSENSSNNLVTPTILPRLFMGVLVLPPAYNVEQFFRCCIVHSFSFKDFTSSLNLMDPNTVIPNQLTGSSPPYTNWIDYGDTLDSIGAKTTPVSDGVM